MGEDLHWANIPPRHPAMSHGPAMMTRPASGSMNAVSYTHIDVYKRQVRRLGGQVIEIAPDSPHHLNPMDVELNMAAGESPLSMKADFL